MRKIIIPTVHEIKQISNFLVTLASAGDGALRERPGTDYYERNCDPEYSPSKGDFGGRGSDGGGGGGDVRFGDDDIRDDFGGGHDGRPISAGGKGLNKRINKQMLIYECW